jgi:hypothetical protein
LQASEVLHKRSVLVERGSFRPVTHVNIDMLRSAGEAFSRSLPEAHGEVVQIMEITMRNLMAGGEIDPRDFLARADVLAAVGKTVLISDYFEYYRLAAYLRRCTNQPLAITMGASSLIELFDEKYYTDLEGGILESFGRLFRADVRLYVYPFLDPANDALITVDNLPIAPELHHLYRYLVERGCIVKLDNYQAELLPIFSRDTLKRIKAGDASWETHVPPEVANVIKRRSLFGWRPPAPLTDGAKAEAM